MITITVLLILGGLLVIVLKKMFSADTTKPSQPGSVQPAAPAASTASIELANARPGDVISVPGAAEDFSDVDFTVDRRSAYESMNRKWPDLSGEFRGRRVYLELQGGGEIDVLGILDGRRLTLADLGITEDQLTELDRRQDTAATVSFQERQWNYQWSREIGYFENEAGDGEGLYRWMFREQGGNRVICIEKWEGEPFEARIGQLLNPRDITVFRAA